MSKAFTFRFTKFVAVMLIAFVAALALAESAHAHGGIDFETKLHPENPSSEEKPVEDWIFGHCHGGPSCSGGLYLSEITRPEGIDFQSRRALMMSEIAFVGRLPTRDPPVPILLF